MCSGAPWRPFLTCFSLWGKLRESIRGCVQDTAVFLRLRSPFTGFQRDAVSFSGVFAASTAAGGASSPAQPLDQSAVSGQRSSAFSQKTKVTVNRKDNRRGLVRRGAGAPGSGPTRGAQRPGLAVLLKRHRVSDSMGPGGAFRRVSSSSQALSLRLCYFPSAAKTRQEFKVGTKFLFMNKSCFLPPVGRFCLRERDSLF